MEYEDHYCPVGQVHRPTNSGNDWTPVQLVIG